MSSKKLCLYFAGLLNIPKALGQITIGPLLNVVQVAAIQTTAVEYSACLAANEILDSCYTLLGGIESIAVLPTKSILKCACCFSDTPISPIYGTCVTYLGSEAPGLTAEASAFSDLNTICRPESSLCFTGRFPTRTLPLTRDTLTNPPSPTVFYTGCLSLGSSIASCVDKVPHFTDLPSQSQAECFCYSTNARGSTTWVPDEFESGASSCAHWASAVDSTNIYSVASSLMSFCHRFGDFQDATISKSATLSTVTITNAESSTPTSSPTRTIGVTVIVTPTQTPSSANSGLGCSYVVAMCAFVIIFIMAH